MLDSFRQKQRWCDKVMKYFSVMLWLKRDVPKSSMIIIAATLAAQIFLPKWHIDNLAMLKSSVSTSLAPSWLNRATSPCNCTVLVFLCICPVNRTRLPLYVYIAIYQVLDWRNLCIFCLCELFRGLCVLHIEVQRCQFVELLSVQIIFPNCSLWT